MKTTLFYVCVLVILTSNVFSQWKLCPKVVSDPLWSVSIYDSLNVWASGGDGTVIRSEDGGINWKIYTVPTLERIHKVIALNKSTALAFAFWDGVFKTSDNGNTWSKVIKSRIALGGYSVSMLVTKSPTSSQYYAVSHDGNEFMKSADSGDTWEPVSKLPTKYELWNMLFLNDSVGYVSGSSGLLLKTTDAGNNWTKIIRGITSDWLFRMHHNNDTIFIAGTESGTSKSSTYALDLKNEDSLTVMSQNNTPPLTIFSYSGKYWWNADNQGGLYSTSSLLDTWNKEVYRSGTTYNSIEWLGNTGIGYYVTSQGEVYKTTNHGQTATGININTSSQFLIYPNPTNSYVIVDYGDNSELSSYSFVITNSLGQEKVSSKFTSRYQQIDISGIGGAGLYIISIRDNNNNVIETRKLLIQ